MSGIKKIAAFIAASKTSRILTGWGSWFASSWLFDDLLYPLVIAWLGPVQGGLIMTALAATICWVWLKGVVASDKEWFGMDILHKIQRIAFWSVRIAKHIPLVKKSWVDAVEKGLTLLLINIVFDPMISVLYYRHGNLEKVITPKDKRIFFWSVLVSNTYWTLRNWGLVTIVRFIWKNLQEVL